MQGKSPIGVISIGSNDIHLLVAASDGIKTFDRHVNQSMLAELVGTVTGGVIPVPALNQTFTDLETPDETARTAGASPIIAIATEALREVANGPAFIELLATMLHSAALERCANALFGSGVRRNARQRSGRIAPEIQGPET